MYGNVKRTNMQAVQNLVADTVKQVVNEMNAPKTTNKLIEADGGAYRAYNYNLLKPKKH